MKEDVQGVVNTWQNLRKRRHNLLLVFYSIIVGILTGYVIVAYREGLDFLNTVRHITLLNVKETLSWMKISQVVIIFIGAAIILQKLLSKFPLISGSGIPQVKALLMKQIKFNWFYELISKFLGGLLSIGSGLSLGREGPSIHLGAQIGEGVNSFFKTKEAEKKYLITSGASAGLAAAFNAPLSGVIFSLEELHKFFSPLLLICTLLASISADFITKLYLGYDLVFDFDTQLPEGLSTTKYLISLIVFGIFIGLAGKLFTDGVVLFQKLYKNIKLNSYVKAVLAILLSLFIGLFFSEIAGGGHHLIQDIAHRSIPMKVLFILLIAKFIFTLFSYSTGFPGGIFLPMLVVGAILGKIYGMFLVDVFGLEDVYGVHFMILGMAGYLTAVVRAPITGIILILEMTGRFDHLFSLTLVATLAYVLTEFINLDPIYDILYRNMISNLFVKEKSPKKNSSKVTLLIPVIADSIFDGKHVFEISWPENCLLVGIRREIREIIPKGMSKIKSGDFLIVLTDKRDAGTISPKLYEMGTMATVK
ncbi:ClC family H(+)/Cl(-) exchange transporter [Psychrilyobacter sp.]|uniref:ClC family H(+)/Cl(-) exchange transporter n=1 Tax=Psychrilyobacter sp. TaxID=2586924 RepID=UPI003019C90B